MMSYYDYFANPPGSVAGAKTGKYITTGDMEAHIKEGGAWVVIHGEVYDVESIATCVPCGVDKLMENVGRDATEVFETAGHSDVAREKMKQCLVGEFREVRGENSGRLKG